MRGVREVNILEVKDMKKKVIERIEMIDWLSKNCTDYDKLDELHKLRRCITEMFMNSLVSLKVSNELEQLVNDEIDRYLGI